MTGSESHNRLYKKIDKQVIRTELYVRTSASIKVSAMAVTEDDLQDDHWVTPMDPAENITTAELVTMQEIMASNPLEREGWKQAFAEELGSHESLDVHVDIPEEEALRLEKLGLAEIIPGKAVCTRKPVTQGAPAPPDQGS